MLNLVPLQGEQAGASSFPIDTPVYIFSAADQTSPAHVLSSGTVVGVLLQMGRPGTLELLYKVNIDKDWNGDDVKQQTELVRESRLRFRNGCPVYVQVDDSECMGKGGNGEAEGIILGFYDIPKDDERRPYCNYSFWYIVQLSGSSKDEEFCSSDKRICYNVSPSEVRFRRYDDTKYEIKNILEENVCENFKTEMNNDDDGDGDEETNESVIPHTMETIPDEVTGGSCMQNENASRINDDASTSQVATKENAPMIGQSIEYCTLENKNPPRKNCPDSECLEVSIKNEELDVPSMETQTSGENVINTNISTKDKDEAIVVIKGNIIGSKRSYHDISDEHPDESLTVVTASPSKLRRVEDYEKNSEDVDCAATDLSSASSSHDGAKTNDAMKNEESNNNQRQGGRQEDCVTDTQQDAADLGKSGTIEQDELQDAALLEKKKGVFSDDDVQQDGAGLEKKNGEKTVQPISDPQKTVGSSTKAKNATNGLESKFTNRNNTLTFGGESRRLCCWIESTAGEIFRSLRKPGKKYPFGSVLCVPTSSSNVIGALVGRGGGKREALMRKTKCWYAIAHSHDIQRIEIQGDTKTLVEKGTEIIRKELHWWLEKCDRGQVDAKWIILNTTVKYYVLDRSTPDSMPSANIDQLHAQRSLKHSQETKPEEEGTLQILLPPMEKNKLYGVVIGCRGEKHKRLLRETDATSIKVNYSDKGSSIIVRSCTIFSARKACVFILSDIQREIGPLSGAKICYPS